jgi:DNA oxidative demethylase
VMHRSARNDLLGGICPSGGGPRPLAPGATLLRAFAGNETVRVLDAIRSIEAAAPFRHMMTPGGFRMSVAMTNSGIGWVTDRRGYRYDAVDPETGKPWPPIPSVLSVLASHAAETAGFHGFVPDACLINRYEPGAKMSLHQDKDERDFRQPIVSLSLGLPAIFLWGGEHRGDRPRRIPLESGDIMVWGGPSRLVFHGVDKLPDGTHLLTGPYRYNLTFRRAL